MNHEERVAYNKAYYIKNREKLLTNQTAYRKTHSKEIWVKNYNNSQLRKDKRIADRVARRQARIDARNALPANNSRHP